MRDEHMQEQLNIVPECLPPPNSAEQQQTPEGEIDRKLTGLLACQNHGGEDVCDSVQDVQHDRQHDNVGEGGCP